MIQHLLSKVTAASLIFSLGLTACTSTPQSMDVQTSTPALEQQTITSRANPLNWAELETAPLDLAIEARIDDLLSKMTLEQKVGQVIQADSASVTAEDVKKYRLGSVLSGGNSAPGPLPYADTQSWLEAADAYYNASIDPEGVEVAIPTIWGIDAVHGHANLIGATIFPHNIGLGAANNPDLIEEIYKATALELRVSGHDWTFAPTLAVPQNDRWGRTYEGFSEDPNIVNAYGARIAYGLQGRPGAADFLGENRVLTSAKHFLADGGTLDGIDQGDALITEAELRDIHAAGYMSAIPAGVQTVMASYSAWHGERMHGHKVLLMDVLKDRMNFQGFVVGDWNGHALIPSCTATDCPQSFNAGVDMYMAPDSWEALWHSTLGHVQSGEISVERLDEAVRRILRVKLNYGLFDLPKPSARSHAGDETLLGKLEHRNLARQAVRESLVLLKNNDGLLPLDASKTILVVGDGADSIAKASGGWTLSWQGGVDDNKQFPNGETILSGITKAVSAAGGTMIFSPDGSSDINADYVIAVYGEDPYAEFQGDLPHVDFVPNGFDPNQLGSYQAGGAKTVSVFLSGRPLWTNPEINQSDAFIAAWLPGSEGGGIADMLFQTDPSYEFTGRLSYSWPKQANQTELNPQTLPYDPLFALGYGLTYGQNSHLAVLSEDSGLVQETDSTKGVFFEKGRTISPWALIAEDAEIEMLPADTDHFIVSAIDHSAQEDALKVSFKTGERALTIAASAHALNLQRETNADLELSFYARSIEGSATTINIGMGHALLPVILSQDWQEVRLTLSCFADRGVDMQSVFQPFAVSGQAGEAIGISDIRLKQDLDGVANCGD